MHLFAVAFSDRLTSAPVISARERNLRRNDEMSVSADDVYFDIFKRNMDTRRQLIMAVLVAVVGFGAWLLQQNHTQKIVNGWSDPNAMPFYIAFLVTWPFYFFFIAIIDINVRKVLKKLEGLGAINSTDRADIKKRLNYTAQFAPFLIAVAIYLAIIILP
jgi:hypothetical protein